MIIETPYNMGPQDIPVLNPDDKGIWRECYYIGIGHYRSIEFIVYADCLSSAIDEVIDWAETQNCPGWWLDETELNEEADNLDEYINGGNHCRYMSFGNDELLVRKLDHV